MAAPMSNILRSWKFSYLKSVRVICRTYLSDTYSCDELWNKRLEAKSVKGINAKKFGIGIWNKCDEEHAVQLLDMDLFSTKVNTLKLDEEYIAKEVIFRFRHSQCSFPIKDCIVHSIVRGYIEAGFVDRLIPLMQDKDQYGLLPDDQAMCILLNYLLTEKKYAEAGQVAYEVMLQEDYNHILKNMLALIAAVKHFTHTCTFKRYEPQQLGDEDPQYIPKSVITNPYYDDHFDIKDERFLLGKTLYNLGKHTQGLDGTLSRTLQLIGLGLYEKFELANQLLTSWMNDSSLDTIVYEIAIEKYEQYLEEAPHRDPHKAEKKMGEKTIDDEIELLRLTPDEKLDCIQKFEVMKRQLKSKSGTENDIEKAVEDFIWNQKLPKYEETDTQILKKNYEKWMRDRERKFEVATRRVLVADVEGRVQERLEVLQERQELLEYFDNLPEIRFLQKYRKEEVEVVEKQEEFVQAPGERNIKLKIKKK
ncbi:28S ribosomal protein S27, mitochondrial-like [Mya arenaria]|uniref:28S ribosomal protein S27, mitochondrial-like n=1 Tax=Mya arenaria TaxID=6604 RepID=UPI0022E3AB67|nr:28S ribosomal protein S27, mitochondrial-like [Mya arenaria]